MGSTSNARRRRILVVEDDFLIALMISGMLTELGCDVIGPVGRVSEASLRASTEPLDGALLDVNVQGELIFRVADELARRGVPIAFVTGYGTESLPDPWKVRPVLTKPFDRADIEFALRAFSEELRAHQPSTSDP